MFSVIPKIHIFIWSRKSTVIARWGKTLSREKLGCKQVLFFLVICWKWSYLCSSSVCPQRRIKRVSFWYTVVQRSQNDWLIFNPLSLGILLGTLLYERSFQNHQTLLLTLGILKCLIRFQSILSYLSLTMRFTVWKAQRGKRKFSRW